ncbi:PKD domain-containing protein [Arthrobacter sp. NPDC055585]
MSSRAAAFSSPTVMDTGRGLRRLPRRHKRRAFALMCAAGLVLSGIGLQTGTASADTAPLNPGDPATPVTVSSDPLPTAQLDGVAWQQVIVGDVVYVVGKFTRARPANAAPGAQTVTRNNILAYQLSTGVLLSSFAPSLNGQALSIAASPDGSRIYVGGDFTSVNGTARSRIVALNTGNGSIIQAFNPKPGGSVRALAATADTVYAGGSFIAVGSASRDRLAAFRASDGALLPWNPKANNRVNALVLAPNNSAVVVGGAFSTLNGSNRPGYGLGRVNATTGASMSLGVNNTVRNAGKDSAILSLSSDGVNFYGTGYIFGTGGNLEGSFSGNWSDGSLKWVEDCHGDSYGIWASSTAVYLAGHPHYCGNIGGFPQTEPRTWYRAVAFSKAATGTMTKDIHGYPSFTGVPSPSLLNWFPDLDTGTATGQSQGPWAVAGNSSYVAMAGEFRNVNNKPQQGLVRFAVRQLAPNKDGPRVSGARANPALLNTAPGTVRVRWQANHDRDNEVLTYEVIRDSRAAPVHTVRHSSRFYQRPTLEFVDSGLPAGEHTYRIHIRDPLGNQVKSDIVRIQVAGETVPAPEDPDPPEPGPSRVLDNFDRSGTGNWGAAGTGGDWRHTGSPAHWAVDGTGSMLLDRPGLGLTAQLPAVALTDTDMRFDSMLDNLADGSGVYLTASARLSGTGEYQAVAKVSSSGRVVLDLNRVTGGTATRLASRSVSGLTAVPGTALSIRFQVRESAPALVSAKVWPAGSAEPETWTSTAADSSAPLAAGSIALTSYVSGSSTNVPVRIRFDNLTVAVP